MKMTFQEIRIIATAPCIANQLRDVNTICRRSWYIAAHIWKIYDFKNEVVPLIINILKLCKTNITCNITCFPRTWCHKTFHFTVLFQTTTFEIQRYLFSGYMTSFSAYHLPVVLKKKSFSSQNLFFTSFIIFLDFHFRPRIYFYYQYRKVAWSEVTSFPVTSLPVAHLSQVMMAYRSSKQSSTDQTPNMPPRQYSQSNDEEPYYILKTNNPFLFWEPLYCNVFYVI